MQDDDRLTQSPCHIQSNSPSMTCRETYKNTQLQTLRLPTDNYTSPDKQQRQTSASKCKSTNLQVTMRKPIKVKLFEKDTEKMKVMCFEFPAETNSHVLSPEEQMEEDQFNNIIVQNMSTAYRGLALSKFKMLRNFFNTYQEEKKRVQKQDMNILGLRIKKIDYSKKTMQKDDNRRPRRKSSNYPPAPDDWEPIAQSNHGAGSTTGFESQDQSQTATLHAFNRSEFQFVRSQSRTQCRRTSFISSKSKPKDNKSPKKSLKFNNGNEHTNKIYQSRIQLFQQFVFRINFAHNIFTELFDTQNQQLLSGKCQTKFKVWIGPGNNSLLLKSLFKKRFWWTVLEEKSLNQVNFVWTQLKDNNLFMKQKPSMTQQLYHKWVNELEAQEDDTLSPERNTRTAYNTRSKIAPEDNLKKIMSKPDEVVFKKAQLKWTMRKNKKFSLSAFKDLLKKPLYSLEQDNDQSKRILTHNHLQNNFFLGNKKAMFHNLKQYYELRQDNVFNYLPLTFHIKNGIKDVQYKRFVHYYKKRAAFIKRQEMQNECESDEEGTRSGKPKKMRNIWIIKPGELSNRGNGITVVDQLYQVNSILTRKDAHSNGTAKTYIVQLYIDRPMLYNRRKFDIRHYMMISNLYGVMRGYWYSEGYIRTSGYEFDITNFEREVHLTNDAVQKHCENYSRYEPANKLSYGEFQRYLDTNHHKKKYSFERQILPKMKQIATDAVKSVFLKLSPGNLQHNFEIFGLDFMIDENFKVWLIEINTNPCLELCCPLLSRLIPFMVEQSLRLTVDVVYPPPCHYSNTNKHLIPDMSLANLKYQLIFDSLVDGEQLRKLYRNVKTSHLLEQIGEMSDDEQYADNGVQLKMDAL